MAIADARELLGAALDALDRLLRAGDSLAEALHVGSRIEGDMPADPADGQALQQLQRILEDLDRKAHLSLAPTHDIHRRLSRCLGEGLPAPLALSTL